jgi:hypothetical protein
MRRLLHFRKALGAVAFPIKHNGEAVQRWDDVELFTTELFPTEVWPRRLQAAALTLNCRNRGAWQ